MKTRSHQSDFAFFLKLIMSRKDKQINELYQCVSELDAKVRALTSTLVQVSAIVNRKVEVLGPMNDKRFYLLRTTAALHDWDAA